MIFYRLQTNRYEMELAEALAESQHKIEILESMVDRFTRSKRIAQMVVTDQDIDDITGKVNSTEILMVELDKNGEVCDKHKICIQGDIAYFDGLVIKFDKDCVAVADPLRGHSLVLLRRVFSDEMRPQDGYPLDEPGKVPAGYRISSEVDEFEKLLWQRFWDLANDPKLAQEYGVRVAQGEIVYKPMKPGLLYELTIDAIGGLNLETLAVSEVIQQALVDG